MRSRDWSLAIVVTAVTALFQPLQEMVSAQSGPGIVISQYRLHGVTPNDEFIELFNNGATPVNVSGWVFRTSNNAASPTLATRATIPAGVTINPGCYYLIANVNLNGGYSGNASPDLTYTIGTTDDSGIAIAIMTAPNVFSIVDQVGQGTSVNAYGEGTRLPALLTNADRGVRRKYGVATFYQDTNDNFADFKEILPGAPHNSSAASCVVPVSPSVIATASPSTVEQGQILTVFGNVTPGGLPPSTGLQVSGNLSAVGGSASTPLFDNGVFPDATANDRVFTASVTVPAGNPLGLRPVTLTVSDTQGRSSSHTVNVSVVGPAATYRPHDVQGAGATSPIPEGTAVTVRGVVTARAHNGFFLQTEAGEEDSDDATSEGLFVYTGSAPPVIVQPRVVLLVAGSVNEFAAPGSAPVTRLTSVVGLTYVRDDVVPAPYPLTATDVSDAGDPGQLERFEGMRVSVDSLTAASGTGGNRNEATASSVSDGAFYAVLTGQARPFRTAGVEAGQAELPCAIGPCNVPHFDGNPERLRVSSAGLEGVSGVEVSTGAIVEDVTGPLDYAGGAYTILPETTLSPLGGTVMTGAPAAAAHQFTVASFNLDRFYDATDNTGDDVVLTGAAYNLRLAKASQAIRSVMNTPDIVGVQGVENLAVLTALANRVNGDAAPSPQYVPYLFEGTGDDGLDVGFLLKQAGARVSLLSVEQVDATATFVDPTDNSDQLLYERPPVMLRATVSGPSTLLPQTVTVFLNHGLALDGVASNDANGARVRAQRQAQALSLANLIQARQSNDPAEAIVSIGDYNAFNFNDGYVDVVGTVRGVPAPPDEVATEALDVVSPELTDAGDTLPESERYSFVSRGTAQTFDHVLVSASLAPQFNFVVRPRVNADFPEVLRGDGSTPARVSDRDPVVAYFSFPADTAAPVFSFLPENVTAEATGPGGAVVAYLSPTASDNLDSVVTVDCSPASGSNFPLGNTGVVCSVEDAAGNVATAPFTVTVHDTTPPALTVPAHITEEATSLQGKSVTFVATATDAVTPSPAATCTPASGSTFPLGDTLVSCVATDAAGNTGSAAFIVTVRDNTAPVLTVPANIIAEATSSSGAPVSFVATATDAVTPSPAVGCTPASGNTLQIGDTLVSCVASDEVGNSVTATFTVTVRDTTAPIVTVPAGISEETTSPSGKAVSFVATATDAVTSVPTVICTPASGSTFPVGSTLVSCVATDVAGNRGSATFTVTITQPDTQPAPVSGRLAGEGHVLNGLQRAWFAFDVSQSASSVSGQFQAQLRAGNGSTSYLVSAGLTGLQFSDALLQTQGSSSVRPGQKPVKPASLVAKTVTFSGVGSWNGTPGYRFEVTASDRGEPGKDVDTFFLVVYAPNGNVVASANGLLQGGNIQSFK